MKLSRVHLALSLPFMADAATICQINYPESPQVTLDHLQSPSSQITCPASECLFLYEQTPIGAEERSLASNYEAIESEHL